jgi:hypothetical protein
VCAGLHLAEQVVELRRQSAIARAALKGDTRGRRKQCGCCAIECPGSFCDGAEIPFLRQQYARIPVVVGPRRVEREQLLNRGRGGRRQHHAIHFAAMEDAFEQRGEAAARARQIGQGGRIAGKRPRCRPGHALHEAAHLPGCLNVRGVVSRADQILPHQNRGQHDEQQQCSAQNPHLLCQRQMTDQRQSPAHPTRGAHPCGVTRGCCGCGLESWNVQRHRCFPRGTTQ